MDHRYGKGYIEMKRIATLLMMISMSATLLAGTLEDAHKAYEEARYEEAAALYSEVVETKGASATVYYNLGNAHYKQQEWARAILYYERALRINSRMKDARFNLELTQTHIRDKIEPVPRPLLSILWQNTMQFLAPASWLFLAILFTILAATAAFLLYRSNRPEVRRPAFNVLLFSAITALVVMVISLSTRHYMLTHKRAVIMEPTVILRSEPSESSTSLFILHEGLTVDIERSERDWFYVSMPDGNTGWLRSEVIETI